MKNVLLVFGGMSYEHDISVVTASQIFNKTKSEKFKLIPLYISRENKMFLYESKVFDIKEFSQNSFSSKNKRFKEVSFVSAEKNRLFQKSVFGLKECLFVENAIIACHGGCGENGKLISLFENMGIKCSSGNFDALAVCMNKYLFKQVMKGVGVPIVSGYKLSKLDYLCEEYKNKLFLRLRFMRFPVVIKPCNGGSSIGLFVAESYDDFDAKVKEAFEFDDVLIIEKYVSNAREFNVAIIGTSSEFEVSEIDEPLKNNDVLSFADKYLSGGKSSKKLAGTENSMVSQKRRFPADISEELREKIRQTASKIFKNLKLAGVVRIDFLFNEETNKLYVCEVNSVPGSLAYYFFEGNKIVLNNFVEKLLKISEVTWNDRLKINNEFVTNILD